MANRLTSTDKFKKPFIRGLKGAYKLLWLYILDECDHAGIWIVDFEVAQIRVGDDMPINGAEAERVFGDKIVVFSGGEKWFIPSFIDFQYKDLNPQNRVHSSVIQILKKNNLMGLTSPLEGDKDKDKDNALDKVEGGTGETKPPETPPPPPPEISTPKTTYPTPTMAECKSWFKFNSHTESLAEDFFNHYEATGWIVSGQPIMNWKAKAAKWMKDPNKFNQDETGTGKPPERPSFKMHNK